jgi:hypothetical protein
MFVFRSLWQCVVNMPLITAHVLTVHKASSKKSWKAYFLYCASSHHGGIYVPGQDECSCDVDIACACLHRYLGGVLDFTGELNRYAIARATLRDVEAVRACRDLVQDIMAEFLEVTLPITVTYSTPGGSQCATVLEL